MFLILFLYLVAAVVAITGGPRPQPKEGMLETQKILITSLFGLPFPVVKPCKRGFLYMKSRLIHSGHQFFVMIPFNTV